MPASEFAEWKIIHEKFDPFGSEREDLRAGSIASPLLNIQLSRRSRKTKPGDWILKFVPTKPQTEEQMKAVFRALAQAYANAPKKDPPRVSTKAPVREEVKKKTVKLTDIVVGKGAGSKRPRRR